LTIFVKKTDYLFFGLNSIEKKKPVQVLPLTGYVKPC